MTKIRRKKSITSELKRQKKLIEKQKNEIFRLRNVIDTLPGSIYWKDKKGVYLGRNHFAAEKMKSINLPTESVIGKTDYDLFTKEVANGFRKHDLEVMESGLVLSKEEDTILPDGSKIIQLSTKKPLRDQKGKIVGIVGNTIDITPLKKIEEELRIAKEKAEEADHIKTEFIHNMEHDIRTPFSGVYALAKILVSQETDEEKKENLEDIANCAKELLDYFNSILYFSKIGSGNLPISVKKFDLHKLIEGVIDMEKPPAKHKKLKLIFDYQNDIPKIIVGDQYRLQRILINLVSNAIKFTHQGYVKISARIAKRVDDKNIVLRIVVEDTGIGIPKDKQEFIYEKFARISPSNEGVYKGTGLGLSVVRQLVQELNGEIEVVSELGKGSIFICTLPFRLPLVDDIFKEN